MNVIKKKLKRVLSILTVAVILLSTLPIGASAALADGTVFMFNIDLGNDAVPGAPAKGPFSIGYTSGSGTSLAMNLASSSTLSLGLTGYYGKTVKDKYLVFRTSPDGDYLLGLTPVYGHGSYIFFTAPANGFYNFDFELINLNASDNESITYSFFYKPPGYAPVCHIGHTALDIENFSASRSLGLYMQAGGFVWLEVNNDLMVSDTSTTFSTVALTNFTVIYDSSGDSSDNVLYNSSHSIIYGYFPDGTTKEIARIYAPYHHVGYYSCDLSYLTSTLQVPTSYDGYSLDFEASPATISVADTYVLSYVLLYRGVVVDEPEPDPDPEPNYNEGIHNFYAVLPSGLRVPLGEVRPPSDYEGNYTYTYYDASLNFSLDDWQLDELEGYEIDKSLFDTAKSFTIVDDEIREINIPYIVTASTARSIRFELYDVNYNLLYTETVHIPVTQLTCNTPIYDTFDTFPYFVDIDTSLDASVLQTFKCCAVDLSAIRDQSYNNGYKFGYDSALGEADAKIEAALQFEFERGFDSGIEIANKDIAAQLNVKYREGYDQGFKEGYDDGSELTGKERSELMTDYNAITGFFDGIFNAIFGSIDIVFNGVGIGGISLGTVIWTLVIIVIVVIVGGKLIS